MADPNDPSMNPDDMLRAYMGPSARTGPEAVPQCLICGSALMFMDNGAAQTCRKCEDISRARNSAEEHGRSQKLREAYFAGLDENSPELQRELAASKGRAMTLSQQLAAHQRELAKAKHELSSEQRKLKEAHLDLQADAVRKNWEGELASLGLAPVAKANRLQLVWAFAAGALFGVTAYNAFSKAWRNR